MFANVLILGSPLRVHEAVDTVKTGNEVGQDMLLRDVPEPVCFLVGAEEDRYLSYSQLSRSRRSLLK